MEFDSCALCFALKMATDTLLWASDWFSHSKINDYLFLVQENKFFPGNRCNIWVIKGPNKDILIDTGLGVCNLKEYLLNEKVISDDRECIVLCTHVHFDHSGGAHHFEDVRIHEDDQRGLVRGRQVETLNWVQPHHFYSSPYPGFSARSYKVPPTTCTGLKDKDTIDIGGGHHLEIMHNPGHTKGSMSIFYPQRKALFSGDMVYNTDNGANLLDWLPTSSVREYIRSSYNMIDFLANNDVANVYPGHFEICQPPRITTLLQEYVDQKENCPAQCCASCLQCTSFGFLLVGCGRCCPCGAD